ncbi:Sacsin [Achaetomium macrosporum]|uniref:Sacsin n=1 Tax=Achaetomium macrosporum TaxID=79813 RepID=A0AAN7H5D0_9PEZI|nr:Sacsin [Achaetomium macrosporum]
MLQSLYEAIVSFTQNVWEGSELGTPSNRPLDPNLEDERQVVRKADATGDGNSLPDMPGGWLKRYERSFPKSKGVARKHIEQLWAQRQADKSGRAGNELHKCLILFGRPNTTPTRFLYELLQNADDNKYHDRARPILTITYTDNANGKTLRIDSNEIGFSAEDIEAICSVANGQKLGDPSRIGEKGLGFKSVFSFSDSVWITSGFYSFKLVSEKTVELGSVTPVWEVFPRQRLPRHTSILLSLLPDSGCDANELVAKLRSLEPALLFLRKLKEVKIKILQKDIKPWETSLERRVTSFGIDNTSVHSILKDGVQHISYRVFREEVSELGYDAQRSGRGKSDLMLAFPTGEPKSEDLYTFLPVADFGLMVCRIVSLACNYTGLSADVLH